MESSAAGTTNQESESAAERPRRPGEAPKGVVRPSGKIEANRFLSDVIVELGFAAREIVDSALDEERRKGRRMGRFLVESGALTEQQLGMAVAERYGLDYLDLNAFEYDMAASNLITVAAARRYETIPVSFVDPDTLLLAIADPTDGFALNDIAVMTRLDVQPAVAARGDILALIDRLPAPEEKQARPSPVIRRHDDEEKPTRARSKPRVAKQGEDLAAEKSQLLKELREAIAAEGDEESRRAKDTLVETEAALAEARAELESERERWEIEHAKLEAKLIDASQSGEKASSELAAARGIEKQVDELAEKNAALESQIVELKNASADGSRRVEELEQRNKALEKERDKAEQRANELVDEARREVEDKSSGAERLERELTDAREGLEQARAETDAVRAEVERERAEREQLDKDATVVQQERESLDKQIEKEREQAVAELKEVAGELREQQKLVADFERRNEKLERKRKDSSSGAEKLERELDDARDSLEVAETEIEQLRAEAKQQHETWQSEVEKLEPLEQQTQQLTAELESSQLGLEASRADLEVARSDLSDARAEIDQSAAAAERVQGEIAELERRLDAEVTAHEQLGAERDHLIAEREDMQARLAELQGAFEQVRNEAKAKAKIEQELTDAQSGLDRTRETLAELQDEARVAREGYEAERDGLQSQLAAERELREALEHQRNALEKTLGGASADAEMVAELETKLLKAQAEIESLSTELGQGGSANPKLEAELTQAREDRAEAKEQITELKDRLAEFKVRLGETKEELGDTRERLADAERRAELGGGGDGRFEREVEQLKRDLETARSEAVREEHGWIVSHQNMEDQLRETKRQLAEERKRNEG